MQAEREILLNALFGVAAPAGTALVVLAACRGLAREPGAPVRRAAPALALGLGFAAGYAVIQGWPPLTWELTIRQWLFYWALALGAFGVFEAHAGRGKLAARALLAVLAPLLLLEFQRAQHWARVEGVAWTAGLAVFVFAGWQLLSALEERRAHAAGALGLACTTALAAGAFGLSGSQLIAQLAGALAVAAGLCALAGLLWRRAGLGACGVGAFWIPYQGLVWCARFISELSWTGFVLLSLAPLALAVPARTKRGTWLAALAPLLLAGAALVIEWRDQPESTPYGY